MIFLSYEKYKELGDKFSKTAKEMFEDFGFCFDITEYRAYKPDYNFVDEDGNAIIFDLENKKIDITTNTTITITNPKEFTRAINKQIEELGWLNENNNI